MLWYVPSLTSRDSVDEEVVYPDNGGVLANSSDEEDDSSSISSKGDCEQPEESPVRMFYGEEPLMIVHLFLEWTPDFIYESGQ